jgi:hypothetical protein
MALAEDSIVHRLKSIGFPQPEQVWGLLNSSEKISFSLPHSGHLHRKELRFLNSRNPGQWTGVFVFCGIAIPLFIHVDYQRDVEKCFKAGPG